MERLARLLAAALLSLVVVAAVRGAATWRDRSAAAAFAAMPTADLRRHVRALLQDPPPAGKQAAGYTLPESAFSSTGSQPASALQGNASGTVSPKANFIQEGWSFGASSIAELNGQCVYGQNCGGGCKSDTYLLLDDGSPDPLDFACWEHDRCLDRRDNGDSEITQYDSSKELFGLCEKFGTANCYCDADLSRRAWEVHNNEKKDCPWWNIFCVEEARPQRAKWVATAMDKKMDCGGCADGKPPNYQPYEPSALPPRDPGPVFPDDTPTGTTGDSTEDTGTDGSADSSGDCSAVTQSNVFLELTGAGEDRYQPADDWGACCALCQEDSVCMAWSWSPENRRCGGGPCCFLRGDTGYTVISKPNDGTGLADRVSGVFNKDPFPSVGTSV